MAHINPLAEGWVTILIHKYPHILEIIKAVPDKSETAFDH